MVHCASAVHAVRSALGGACLPHQEEPLLQDLPYHAAYHGGNLVHRLLQDGQVLQADEQHGPLDPARPHGRRADLYLQELART